MIVYALINGKSREKSFRGYEEADTLKIGYANQVQDLNDGTDFLEMAERYFQTLNRDDRPNAGYAPPLSKGDFLTFIHGHAARSFEVLSVGFRKVDPVVPTTEALIAHLNYVLDNVYNQEGEQDECSIR